MASFKSSPSSSISLPTRSWTYEVFLSFRGKDTRNNFVDHLYQALDQRGMHVFKDDKRLDKGKSIYRELLKAIEESKFAVVVFSKTYAYSSWCLDELVKILESEVIVLPVFYHVDPSDVRGQKRGVDIAFQHHEDRFKGEMDRVNKWRKALTEAAGLSGWHIKETGSVGEAAIVLEIVKKILNGIQPHDMEKNLIGIESHIDELCSLLGMEGTGEARKVGILGMGGIGIAKALFQRIAHLYPLLGMEGTPAVRKVRISGMGGIGKTTIAKALFRQIAHNFEGSSFVEDVRENSSSKKGVCHLQEQILRDVLGINRHDFLRCRDHGASEIQRGLCSKKVLLVLDDVDDCEQLQFLVPSSKSFGPGSIVIITTRDEHLLSGADVKYQPGFLRMNEAVELFCMHAFRRSSPPEGYEDLSDRAIRYASSLPLALKVLGSFFHGRQVGVWESALNRLDKTSNSKIHETLKLSFNGLDVSEKQIFLDIACFFKGRDEKHVIRVLDSFGFDPVIGISVLIEKSLITVYNKRLDIHDLIQEMGWHIVQESFPNSRLWKLDQIHDFIKGKKKPKDIEAILMTDGEYDHVDDSDAKLGLSADVFARMKKLRLLDIDGRFTSTQPTILPDELRWLRWTEYPFLFLPLADRCKLVGLEMADGDIKHLWKGRKILPNLKFIHLEMLSSLTSFPDVSGAPNIERLIMSKCYRLEEVHESLGSHRGLLFLDMNGCRGLKCLPSRLEMESLETLILCGCKSLERFPEVSPHMAKLSHIDLDSCEGIKELPSSITYLSSLSFLNLTNCSNLESIPNSLCELESLKCLHLQHCKELKKFPDKFGSMKMLEELWLGATHHIGMPWKFIGFHTLTGLSSLRILSLRGIQIGEESFPKDLDAFSSLEELDLSGNSKLVRLPSIISHLSCLKRLDLNLCNRLESLCTLPSNLQALKANDCNSLRKIGDLSTEGKWLYKIWLCNCMKLLEVEENQRCLDRMLQQSFIKKCAAVDHRLSIAIPGSQIPSWITQEKDGCRILLKLPHKWHTKMIGFVVCGVFKWNWYAYPRITFRIVSDGKVISKSEVDYTVDANKTVMRRKNVWLSYIPLSFFQEMYHDLQPEDWSHIQGNLDMSIQSMNGSLPVRCGAHVIYKEDVEKITNCISDYGNMVRVNDEDLGNDDSISGNTYVYEEKFDVKSLMPLRSRTSTRRSTKQLSCAFYASRDGDPIWIPLSFFLLYFFFLFSITQYLVSFY